MTKNVNYVSHKKSKVKRSDGKPQLPLGEILVEGEIAVNYAKDVETLSIKNESGSVVTFSSDKYYTKQELGDRFLGEETVQEALDDKTDKTEYVAFSAATNASISDLSGQSETVSAALNDLDENIKGFESALNELSGQSETVSAALNDLDENIKGFEPALNELSGQSETVSAALNDLDEKKFSRLDFEEYSAITKTAMENLTKTMAMTITTTKARNIDDSTPTLAEYTGGKNGLLGVLSHFKLGWFDENGKLVKECAPGRISAARDGSDIPIDGTYGDLMVYVDTDIYRDRAAISGLTVEGSRGVIHNFIGLGLAPHRIGNKAAKRFKPFGFTPHCAKYTSDGKGRSYYSGNSETVQTSINSLTSSVRALNKGGGYMGLYYEFLEIWLIAMYLELGTLDFTQQTLFGNGCTNFTPTADDWFSDSVVGNAGGFTGTNYRSFGALRGSSDFAEMLEAQRIMDGVVKAGFADQISGTKLFTYDSNGNVVEADESVDVTIPSTMEPDKKYFTVRNVPGCQGLSDGVMTGVVNIYHYNTSKSCIIKDSHPVYRGFDLLSGFGLQLEGLHYVLRQTKAYTNRQAPYAELYYCDDWRKVPTDTSLFTDDSIFVSGATDADVRDITLPIVANYSSAFGEFAPIGNGWVKEADYNISLFAHKSIGASQHTNENGYVWGRGTSVGAPYSSSDFLGQLKVPCKSANASVFGCYISVNYVGRSFAATYSAANSNRAYAGAFAHPLIQV